MAEGPTPLLLPPVHGPEEALRTIMRAQNCI